MLPPGGTKNRGLAFLGMGFSTASIMGFMTWLGYQADGRWGTRPWLLLTGALLGVGVAMADMIMTIQRYERLRRKDEEEQGR